MSALKESPPMSLAVNQNASKLNTGICSAWTTVRAVIARQYGLAFLAVAASCARWSRTGSSQPCWFPSPLGARTNLYHSDKGGKDVPTNPSAEYLPL